MADPQQIAAALNFYNAKKSLDPLAQQNSGEKVMSTLADIYNNIKTIPGRVQNFAQDPVTGLKEMGIDAVNRAVAAKDQLYDATTSEGMNYGPKSRRLAALMAEGYNVGGILAPKRFIGKSLEGLPSAVNVGGKLEQFGTDQRLVDIAKNYMADKGSVYEPLTKYSQIDPNRANKLAEAYQVMANNPNDPSVKKAYAALIEETMGQYEALRQKGYKFDFMPESGDIYGNPRNAINDVILNKKLSVFPTEQGFGGPSAMEASQANPLLMRVGEKWNGKEVTANDVFRAVHDVFGHAKHGVGFRAAGEENAFQSHARMYSPEALPAVTSETRGQNSWVNFGPFGKFNQTANPALTEYAEQKTGLLPAWAWKEGLSK
jgi:hypothetical protein